MQKPKIILKLDRTQRLVIAFILVSLVIVLGISLFNQLQPASSADQISEKQKTTNQEKAQSKTKSDDEKVKKSAVAVKDDSAQANQNATTTNNDTQNNQASTAQNSEQNGSGEDKPNDSVVKPAENDQITVSITVIGMNNQVLLNTNIQVKTGTSVYQATKNACSNSQIAFKDRWGYVYAIGDLEEKEHGWSSGWTYAVNGVLPNVGCQSYTLKGTDQVVWNYVNYD